MEFKILGNTVAEYIKGRKEFYQTDVDRVKLVELYREGFPEGTNPMFNERREHDCNTCFHFIRNIGTVVDEDGKSIFRAPVPYPFSEVFKKLADFVESHTVIALSLQSNHQRVKWLQFWKPLYLGMINSTTFTMTLEKILVCTRVVMQPVLQAKYKDV